MARKITVGDVEVEDIVLFGFVLALEKKHKYGQEAAVETFFDKNRSINTREKDVLLGLESNEVSGQEDPKKALKQLARKMGIQHDLNKYRSGPGARDIKDSAFRCMACFCVDHSLMCGPPCALSSCALCCCKSQSFTLCCEPCYDEEQGCCEIRKKCCCFYKEIQCPPGSDIGIGCCGVQFSGQKRGEQLTEQMAGVENANVDFKDKACMIYACACIYFGLVNSTPCIFNSTKCLCQEGQCSLACNNCGNEETGCCESRSKTCCCYTEQQCPPSMDIGMACCGVVCMSQKQAREVDEAYAPMQDRM